MVVGFQLVKRCLFGVLSFSILAQILRLSGFLCSCVAVLQIKALVLRLNVCAGNV